MPDRRLLLLVSLCLWEGLLMAESVAKVVRRRGLTQVHSQLHTVTNQWDQPSLEKNGVPLVRLKEIITADKVVTQKAEQPNDGPLVSNQKELHDFNAKYSQQVTEDSTKMDLRVLKAVGSTRDLLEVRRIKNNTKVPDILKHGRVEKGIPIRRKIDSGLHLNRTRYKSQLRFRAKPSSGFLNSAIGPKGGILDSPHKLNLTGNFGVLKLISKDNLVRIVNSQLQNGLTFRNTISHSRKRDLIDMEQGQMEEPKIKRQDSSVSLDGYESDHHNKSSRLSVEPQSSTIRYPIFRRPVSDFHPNSKDEEKEAEAESVASANSKHHFTHVASTPQSELMDNKEVIPLPSHTDISLSPQAVSDKSYFLDSQTERTVVKDESDQTMYTPGMEFNVTQEPISKASDFVDDSHILKLRPNPDDDRMDKEDVWAPSVTWPLHGDHGLVFQEMEEDTIKGWNPKESNGSRSRSRRSWIWNQFFVIEEYAGPEPVLIGRMSKDFSSDSVPVLKPSAPDWDTVKNINGDMVNGAVLEPSTLPWPEDNTDKFDKVKKAASDPELDQSETDLVGAKESEGSDSGSVRGGVSRTESEREYGAREKRAPYEDYIVEKLPELREKIPHLEVEVEELNSMPEKAAGVFDSSVCILRSSSMPNPPRCQSEIWEEENHAFIGCQDTLADVYYHDYRRQNSVQICSCGGTYRDVLKMGASIFMSALIFPMLVWGGHTFLPFDAPLLDSAPLRLVYTLRCSVFAVVPIVLGVLVLGVSRVRYRSLKPHCDGEIEEVNIHRRYIDDSVSLFLLYFLQLSVMAAYLNQNLLKLVPLLTIIFAIGRLVYWIAAAWGSSLRGFGFGFSFLPMLTMLVANLYFIFMAESGGSIFAHDDVKPVNPPPQESKQRFWG